MIHKYFPFLFAGDEVLRRALVARREERPRDRHVLVRARPDGFARDEEHVQQHRRYASYRLRGVVKIGMILLNWWYGSYPQYPFNTNTN